ncbi:MAG: putative bifunctional diguanylate cyclase/phosphodiesterase, partial [Thiohalorhabdaceae bacterium]
EGPYAVLAIAPSTTTLADELRCLQEKRGLSRGAYLQAANRHLRENLDRFIDVVEATGELIWETDRHCRLTFFTDNLTRLVGLDAGSLRGRDLRTLFAPESRDALTRLLTEAIPEQARQELEAVMQAADGTRRWVALGVTATFDMHGEVDGFRGAARDITEQKAAETERREYRQRLENQVAERTKDLERASHQNRLLLESIGEGVFGVDTAGRFTFINPAGAAMLGYAPGELEGRDSHPLIHAVLADGKPRRATEEPFHRPDGSAFLADLYVAPMLEAGAVTGAVASFHDIRDRKEAEQALAARAYYDELTGLPNRTHLIERAEQTIQRQTGESGKVLLVVLNLDRFKDINDSLGHATGDSLLQRVAGRLYHRTRANETLARLGGDDFACLVADVATWEEAAGIAGRLLDAFAEPLTVGYHATGVKASMGLSLYPDHADSAEVLFQHADAALHRAKEEGRGHYRFYSSDLTQAAVRRVEVEAALREALDRGDVAVHYQPQVELATGCVVGAEALVRWEHPEWGRVAPSEFVPVAEQTGLIHALGREVMRDACQRAAASYRNGLRLGVNVSPVQLEWGDLEAEMGILLSKWEVPRGALEVEVTEEAFLRDPDRAWQVLQGLRSMGVGIAIDDFGSGYSSLAYLKTLQVDRLKIDRSFVTGMSDSPRDAALTRAAAALGRSLD